MRPPVGICIPVRIAEAARKGGITDGDTIRVHPAWSQLEFPVRLLSCWAPETRIRGNATQYGIDKQKKILAAGAASQLGLAELLGSGSDFRLAVPFSLIREANIFDLMTMGRLLGYLWVEDVNVSLWMCARGFAFATKEELLAADLA